MKRFEISRAYTTRYSWIVEAANEAEALAMLEDDTVTQFEAADEHWHGPATGLLPEEQADYAQELL